MNVNLKTRIGGWTLVETLITVAIIAILAAIAIPVTTSFKQRAYRARAIEKLQSLGTAFVSYTADSGGELPWEDAPGSDDWQAAADPENEKAWYNALPDLMGAGSLGSLANSPQRMYDDHYPLYLPGAPYPKSNKKLGKPYFAMAMNSRLQRKNDEGIKIRGTLSSIRATANVRFLIATVPPGAARSASAAVRPSTTEPAFVSPTPKMARTVVPRVSSLAIAGRTSVIPGASLSFAAALAGRRPFAWMNWLRFDASKPWAGTSQRLPPWVT